MLPPRRSVVRFSVREWRLKRDYPLFIAVHESALEAWTAFFGRFEIPIAQERQPVADLDSTIQVVLEPRSQIETEMVDGRPVISLQETVAFANEHYATFESTLDMLGRMYDDVDTDTPHTWNDYNKKDMMFKLTRTHCDNMVTDLTERVQEIAEARGTPESEILKQALERGVEDLWTDLVLSRYVNDEINRETAIELVGRDQVKRAERELRAVEDDVRWGLNA